MVSIKILRQKRKSIKQNLNQKTPNHKTTTFDAVMKQVLYCIFFCGVIAAGCSSTEGKPAKLDAVMKDSSQYTTIEWLDSSIDFGTAKMGEMVNIVFRCRNTGNKPLYLYEVRPGCGCTLADYTKTPIAPGKEGEITARFDTKKSHPGVVNKTVYFSANNSNEVSSYLKFSGTILPDSTNNK